jgi:hypothetical protein
MTFQLKTIVSGTHGCIYSVGMHPSTEFTAVHVHKEHIHGISNLIEALAGRDIATVIAERGNCTIQLRDECGIVTYALMDMKERYDLTELKQSLFVGMHAEASVVEIKPITCIVVAKFANSGYKQEIIDSLPLIYPLLFYAECKFDTVTIYTIHDAIELAVFFDSLMQIYREENEVDLS